MNIGLFVISTHKGWTLFLQTMLVKIRWIGHIQVSSMYCILALSIINFFNYRGIRGYKAEGNGHLSFFKKNSFIFLFSVKFQMVVLSSDEVGKRRVLEYNTLFACMCVNEK